MPSPTSPSQTSWELEAQRFGWKATGRDVARYRRWLRLWLTTDGTMTNLQARANGKQSLWKSQATA